MGRRGGFRDVSVLVAALLQHRGLRLADVIPLELRALDAWGGVHPDEGADAIVRELTDARYAEKLAAQGRVVQARGAKPLREPEEEAAEPCIPDAGLFVA